jgi:copper resistance protein D
MEWLNEGITALAAVRAAHFIASALTAGALIFQIYAGGPATASSRSASAAVEAQSVRLVALGLGLAIVSGAIWFVLTAADMSAVPLSEVFGANILRTVLLDTQFGAVTEARLALAALLGVSMAFDHRLTAARWLGLVAAIGFLGAIAWTGHAGSGLGIASDIHVAADALHLVAAGTWIGGLLPLVLLLSAARSNDQGQWATVAHKATRRYSTLGVASVATLIVTGAINTWLLVGSFTGLVATAYGRLLMIKLSLFAAMLAIAAINRFGLTPALALRDDRRLAIRKLTRNGIIEIILGAIVFVIVGALGTMHPAIHLIG